MILPPIPFGPCLSPAAISLPGPTAECTGVAISEMTSGIINHYSRQAHQAALQIHSQGYANSNMTIDFFLPGSNQVSLIVYDLSGREIVSLVNEYAGAGSYRFLWNTRNVSKGCYTIKMSVGSNTFTRSVPIL